MLERTRNREDSSRDSRSESGHGRQFTMVMFVSAHSEGEDVVWLCLAMVAQLWESAFSGPIASQRKCALAKLSSVQEAEDNRQRCLWR